MKIDFSNQKNIDELRQAVKDEQDLAKFDSFLAEVKLFDFDNDEHVLKAQRSCALCCTPITTGPYIEV